MAESHVVSGLVEKRAEIAGLIVHHKQQLDSLGGLLGHLDATLKLFSPEIDLRTLHVKQHRRRNIYFGHGQLYRFILDALRHTGVPMTCRDLAERAILIKSLDSSPDSLIGIQNTIQPTLKNLVVKGILVDGPMQGAHRTWTIA